MLNDNVQLPPLREELRLTELASDGVTRYWHLYDPLAHRYYLLGEPDITLLVLWHSGTVAVLRNKMHQFGFSLNEEQLEGLLRFLTENQLFKGRYSDEFQKQCGLKNRNELSILDKIKSYKKPLFRAAPILWWLEPLLNALYTRTFFFIWVFLTTFGIYFSARQWDSFLATGEGFFNAQGVVYFSIALLVIKFIHEMGHAYLAQRFGCHVGRVGFATFFFFPMLYTELDDVSRLDSRMKKVLIASGGILTELFIAGIATFFWAVSSDGAFRGLMFIIATTSWVTSLAINLNPFAKFDGYYILSDALNINNLHSRSLIFKRWLIDSIVIGFYSKPPENSSMIKVLFFSAFGFCVWLYQVIIMMTIGIVVYMVLGKFLGGIFLSMVVGRFVVWPMALRVHKWWTMKGVISNKRKMVYLLLLSMITLLMFYPLDKHIFIEGIARAKQMSVVVAPAEARLEYITDKKQVEPGEVIARFYSPELNYQLLDAQLRLELANLHLAGVASNSEQRGFSGVYLQEREHAKVHLEALQTLNEQLVWKATENGMFVDVPESLAVGQWVSENIAIGRVISNKDKEVIALVPENQLTRLKSDADAFFYPDDPSWPILNLSLNQVDNYAIERLAFKALDSTYGGPIKTIQNEDGISVPSQALHKVTFNLTGGVAIRNQLSGQIMLDVEPQSLAEQGWNNLMALAFSELRR